MFSIRTRFLLIFTCICERYRLILNIGVAFGAAILFRSVKTYTDSEEQYDINSSYPFRVVSSKVRRTSFMVSVEIWTYSLYIFMPTLSPSYIWVFFFFFV